MFEKIGNFFKAQSNAQMSGNDELFDRLIEGIASINLQAANVTGDNVSTRNIATDYPAVARASTLISGVVAQMLCNGGLYIRDNKNRIVNTRRANHTLKLFAGKPDRYTPAHTFYEDLATDYCLDGNALIKKDRLGSIQRFTRYSPASASARLTEKGNLIYQALPFYDSNITGIKTVISSERMIHIRWPLTDSTALSSDRGFFATPPITKIRNAVAAGLKQDNLIVQWYDVASKSTLHFDFDFENTRNLTPAQKQQIKKKIENKSKSGQVIVTFGARSTNLNTGPQSDDTDKLRKFQIEEVARYYGIPLPLLSVPVGQWSRGINEQIMKLAWRTCFSLHFNRFNAALSAGLLLNGETFEPDISQLVRGDASGIAELVMAIQGDAQRNPAASRREIRNIIGLPRDIDGEIIETVKDIQPQEKSNEIRKPND